VRLAKSRLDAIAVATLIKIDAVFFAYLSRSVTPARSLLTDRCRQAAEQLASAFRFAVFHGNWDAVDGQRVVCRDDLVDPVRLAAGIGLRTIDFVAEPGDHASVDIVRR